MAKTQREEFENLVRPFVTPAEMRKVMLAYRIAKYGHGHDNELRDDGSRYFDHPREVAKLAVKANLAVADIIIATLLHDVIEDTFIFTFTDIEDIFGSTVCHYVQVVTKDDTLSEVAYYNRMMTGPSEGLLIKICDRIHNLSTIDGQAAERRRRKLDDTEEYILPLFDILQQRRVYPMQTKLLRVTLVEQVVRARTVLSKEQEPPTPPESLPQP